MTINGNFSADHDVISFLKRSAVPALETGATRALAGDICLTDLPSANVRLADLLEERVLYFTFTDASPGGHDHERGSTKPPDAKGETAVYRSPGEDSRLRFPERATPWAQGAFSRPVCIACRVRHSAPFLLGPFPARIPPGVPGRRFAALPAQRLTCCSTDRLHRRGSRQAGVALGWPRYSFPLHGDLFSAAGFFFSPDRSSGPPVYRLSRRLTGLSTRDRSCCPGRGSFGYGSVPMRRRYGIFGSVLRPGDVPVPVVSFSGGSAVRRSRAGVAAYRFFFFVRLLRVDEWGGVLQAAGYAWDLPGRDRPIPKWDPAYQRRTLKSTEPCRARRSQRARR